MELLIHSELFLQDLAKYTVHDYLGFVLTGLLRSKANVNNNNAVLSYKLFSYGQAKK